MRSEYRTSRSELVWELVFTAACLVWMLAIPASPWLLLGPAASFTELAPVWRLVYIPMLVLTVGWLVLLAIDVMRPFWTPGRSVARMTAHGASFVFFLVLARGGPWVAAKAGATLPHAGDMVIEIMNTALGIAFGVSCAISLVEVIREGRRWYLRRKGWPSPGTAAAGGGTIAGVI
jgi:hypothetical protein